MFGDASRPDVKVFPDAAAVTRAGADLFVATAKASVEQSGRFTVALSGGRTPAALYDLLASDAALRTAVPWLQCFLFFGDERHVPPDHPDSNYRMADEALLSRVPISRSHVFRIRGELDNAARAALEYEEAVRSFFQLEPGQVPRFDLVMLGLGPDAHVASLFPGTHALQDREHLVVANWVEKFDSWRITLTVPVLNEAARVMLLVQGVEKARALEAVLHGPRDPQQLPAQLIQPKDGTVSWLVDRAAASLLGSP
jgi:6-phosphogluconolactonase